jgi:hypothetical protein
MDAVSSTSGTDPITKLLKYKRGLMGNLHAQRNMFAKEADNGGDGVTVHVHESKALFHVSLQIMCVEMSLDTRGNAMWLALQAEGTKKNMQAVTGRKFTSKEFSLAGLTPDIDGRPSLTLRKEFFGEAEVGLLSGTATSPRTESEEAPYFEWLGMALATMHAVECPNMDPLFLKEIGFYAKGVSRWRSTGCPLRLVTRNFCKILMRAESLSHMSAGQLGSSGFVAASGLFTPTAEMQTDKDELDNWSRASMQQDMVRFQRASEMAGGSGKGNTVTDERIIRLIERFAAKYPKPDKSVPGQGPRIKHEGNLPKGETRKSSTGGDGAQGNGSHLDRGKWTRLYGGATPASNGASPCFFHWNKAAGCKTHNGQACSKSHTHAPAEHGGKHFNALPVAKQKAIAAKCTR